MSKLVEEVEEEKKILEDVQVADNVRRRRQRQRARRNNRQRRNNNGNNSNNNNNHNNCTKLCHVNHKTPTLSSAKYLSMLPSNVKTWAECVVHPFGEAGIGALKPDTYIDSATSTLDRLNLTFNPEIFSSMVAVQGVLFALVPRSISAGWWARQGANPEILRYKVLKLQQETNQISRQMAFSDNYELLVTVLSIPAPNNTGCYGIFPSVTNPLQTQSSAANTFAFTRFANIAGSCESLRMLGAGLKVWSNAAPIQNGGRCVAGTMVQQDLFETITGVGGNETALTIENLVKHRKIMPARMGATARIDPEQSIKLCTRKRIVMDPNNFSYGYDDTTAEQTIITDYIDPAVYDVAEPDNEIPVVIWRFESSNAADLYSLQVRAIVHSECEPSGDSPFLSKTVTPYPGLKTVQAMVKNPAVFPLSAQGHSFKSFASKIMQHGNKVLKVGQDAMKVLEFAYGFL